MIYLNSDCLYPSVSWFKIRPTAGAVYLIKTMNKLRPRTETITYENEYEMSNFESTIMSYIYAIRFWLNNEDYFKLFQQ